jgi:hypothetical protein
MIRTHRLIHAQTAIAAEFDVTKGKLRSKGPILEGMCHMPCCRVGVAPYLSRLGSAHIASVQGVEGAQQLEQSSGLAQYWMFGITAWAAHRAALSTHLGSGRQQFAHVSSAQYAAPLLVWPLTALQLHGVAARQHLSQFPASQNASPLTQRPGLLHISLSHGRSAMQQFVQSCTVHERTTSHFFKIK